MIMRTFRGLLIAALMLSACSTGSYDRQAVKEDAAKGSALAQIMAECQEQALAPEFDIIRSRINMSMTDAKPAPFMFANMEVPTPAERIQIARWSAIRDSCSQRVAALTNERRAGISQDSSQKVVEITEHGRQRQHALLMALARGEMPYGQFMQKDTLIGLRTAAAIRPFTQVAGVIDQVAIAAPAADQSAAASGAFYGNLASANLGSLALGDAYDAGALGGSALAQIMSECQEQALAPEFDIIRSRVNLSMTGAKPAPFMLANTEVPTAAERIQIARWSAIRDSCSQRIAASISEPPAGMSQRFWQKVVEITEHDSQRQHAMMMALARGRMPYGRFVQEDTLVGLRTAAATRPFTQEAGVIDQGAMAAPAANERAAALSAFFGNLLDPAVDPIGNAYDAGALGGGSGYHHSSGWHGGGHPRFVRKTANKHRIGGAPAPARATALTQLESPRHQGPDRRQ
jgi:hypothetical protein